MRGVKAKGLRRQSYGEGNAMPRSQHHTYKDINGPFMRTVRDHNGLPTGVVKISGTLLITSARRLYKNLKKGIPVHIFREGVTA